LLIFLISINVWANDLEDAAIDARNFMAGKVNSDSIVNANLQEIPGFAGDSPKEASLYEEPNLLQERSKIAAASNEVAQHLTDTASTRPRLKIDPLTDPLFKSRDLDPSLTVGDDSEDPLATARGSVEKTCEEGGDDLTYECFENRLVTVNVPIKTATFTVNHLAFIPVNTQERYVVKAGNFWRRTQYGTRHKLIGYDLTLPKEINAFKEKFCNGFTAKDSATGEIFNIDCSRIVGFKINSASLSEDPNNFTVRTATNALNITLEHQTYENEALDGWTGCGQFEDLVDQGLCQYTKRELTIGPETRNINSYPIFRDDWQYKQIYHCKMIKDECSAIRAQGCTQINSRCKEFRQNKCWIYEQTYSCPDGKISTTKIKSPEGSAFCLTGNCHDASYQANGQMLDVMSKLTMLEEVQKDMNAQKNPYDLKVFKGDAYKCSRNCINFKDCCGRIRGWGVKIHLANCKPEEQQLAQMREQNLCHQVGSTYCAKKVLGRCISKKTSFCCFGTKFAKILQQQGRSQLGISWGEATCPNCRAVTIKELSKLDLSKMNFSELFADLMKKYKPPNLEILKQATNKKITEHMERVTASLKNNEPEAKTGVVGEKKDSL
jgi:type-F conjugative transfer system mating-pair stabilization protein TraN